MYKVRLFFADTFVIVVEYEHPSAGMFDELIAKHGMIIDYKILEEPEDEHRQQDPHGI